LQQEQERKDFDTKFQTEKIKQEKELALQDGEFRKRLQAQEKALEEAQLAAEVAEEKVKSQREEQQFSTESYKIEQEKEQSKFNLKNQERTLREARFMSWVKRFLIVLLLVILVLLAGLVLYWVYRWAVEDPIIKEVVKTVEVPVETIVTNTVNVPVEVVPEECSQVRRNGKIYMNCDGVTIEGSPTIQESGVKDAPELLTDDTRQ